MNLDKRKILLKKMKKLIEEIDKAILIVGDDKKEYLYRFKSVVNQLIKKQRMEHCLRLMEDLLEQ